MYSSLNKRILTFILKRKQKSISLFVTYQNIKKYLYLTVTKILWYLQKLRLVGSFVIKLDVHGML